LDHEIAQEVISDEGIHNIHRERNNKKLRF
jgi:hypothetical protein